METKEIIKELEAYHKIITEIRKKRAGLQILDYPIKFLIKHIKGDKGYEDSLPTNVLKLLK